MWACGLVACLLVLVVVGEIERRVSEEEREPLRVVLHHPPSKEARAKVEDCLFGSGIAIRND